MSDARGTAFPGPGREGGAENPLRTDDIMLPAAGPAEDAGPEQPLQLTATGKPRSLWSDAWHDLIRNPVFVGAALLILALTVVAVPATASARSIPIGSGNRPRSSARTASRAATTEPGSTGPA